MGSFLGIVRFVLEKCGDGIQQIGLLVQVVMSWKLRGVSLPPNRAAHEQYIKELEGYLAKIAAPAHMIP